jgi:hypothetical protein
MKTTINVNPDSTFTCTICKLLNFVYNERKLGAGVCIDCYDMEIKELNEDNDNESMDCCF